MPGDVVRALCLCSSGVTYIGLGSEVWYVGNLSGTISIPGSFLTQWALFGPGVPGVPDGGSVAMLLGAGLAVIGLAQRFLKRQAGET